MKSKKMRILALCLALALLASLCACGKPPQDSPPPAVSAAPSEAPVVSAEATPERTESPTDEPDMPWLDYIYVSSLEELFAAIGSDRTIIVNPGDYSWPEDGEVTAQGFSWESALPYSNPAVTLAESEAAIGITVRDVHNMTLRGTSEELVNNLVQFTSTNRFTDMLIFENCSDIVVEFFNFARPSDEYAYGSNLVLYNCENMVLRSLLFSGGGDGGLLLNECSDILFEGCEFSGISASRVFATYKIERVQVIESLFTYNESPLLDDGGAIQFRGCEFLGNLFERASDFSFDSEGFYTGTHFAGYFGEDYAIDVAAAYVTEEGVSFMVEGSDEVEGEEVYVVRAYIDMDTHIATLHWLYVGMESGRLWEWDLAFDQVIEILF